MTADCWNVATLFYMAQVTMSTREIPESHVLAMRWLGNTLYLTSYIMYLWKKKVLHSTCDAQIHFGNTQNQVGTSLWGVEQLCGMILVLNLYENTWEQNLFPLPLQGTPFRPTYVDYVFCFSNWSCIWKVRVQWHNNSDTEAFQLLVYVEVYFWEEKVRYMGCLSEIWSPNRSRFL
jgi:uncharacterized UBP type Zn finger protein